MNTPTYDGLVAHHKRIHHFVHVHNILHWDQAANMPPGGNEARAAALAELGALLHRLNTEPDLPQRFDAAAAEPLDDLQRANLREMRREWRASNALPEALVTALAMARSRCEHAWRRQRPANDWEGFKTNLREVLRLSREAARHLADESGLAPYDALLDQFEPGMRTAQLDPLFRDLKGWLPGLIERVIQKQSRETVIAPKGPFPVAAQRVLCERVIRLLGFDFDAGRLDVSTHPFCGGVPEDVRMTTRFNEDEFLVALMGTIHETGHARYEQGRPRDWLGQPVSQARSMGIHESQSLSFEMQLACSRPFIGLLAPMVREALGDQPAFEADNLHRLVTRVKRGFIRVDADEVTYPAHVILRYEIERALIEGDIEVDDIPSLWDEKAQALIGIDTRGNYRDGPMQDVHWPEGLFGYFPCYTLGAMYAAQWFAAMRRAMPDLDARIGAGDLVPVFDWLRANVWSQASRWSTDELAVRASGEPLDPAHFRAHLERRYLG